MIVKCVKCKNIGKIEQKDIEHLVNIAKIYTEDISPNDYTAILSIIKGKCTDGKKHLFIYEEEFSKKVAEMIAEHNKLCDDNTTMTNELSDIIKKIENLKEEISDLDNKRINVINNIGNTGNKIDGVVENFEKETGTKNMKIWS